MKDLTLFIFGEFAFLINLENRDLQGSLQMDPRSSSSPRHLCAKLGQVHDDPKDSEHLPLMSFGG